MPRPRDPDRRRLASSRFRDGYAVVIGEAPGKPGVWYMRHGAARKSTGILAVDGNDRLVVKMLDAWVERQLFPPAVATPTEPDAAVPMFGELAAQFSLARAGALSPSTIRLYDQAVAAVFPDDAPLDYVRLVDHLAHAKQRLARPGTKPDGNGGTKPRRAYAPGTIAVYFRAIHAVLDYGVARGAITRNPLDAVGIPLQQPREEIPVYSDDELQRIIAAMRDPRAKLLVALLALTALRKFEALALTRASITPEALRIVGKGSKARKAPVRYIPLNPLGLDQTAEPQTPLERYYHELWAVVGALLALPETSSGLLFPRTYRQYLDDLVRAKRAAGLLDARRFHTLRATAEERWEGLGFDAVTISDQAGHSLPVYVSNYRRRKTPERMGERMRATLTNGRTPDE
jgi:integrase